MLQFAGRANIRPIVRVAILAGLLAAVFGMLLTRGDGARAFTNLADFRAFYCAGSALAGGHDPYLAEPLRSCEIAQTIAAGAQPSPGITMPAPLPGYALAAFALLAHVPFAAAALLFTGLLVASVFVASLALHRLTGYPLPGILGALALCDGWVSTGYGQILPLALMFLCLAAFLVARERPAAAAACAAAAMIEPHLALPACIALFVLQPRTRLPLTIAAAVLGAAALLATGWRINLEYVTSALPAHAIAESNDIRQFSLTTLLHRLGCDAALALKLAELSYAAMAGFGIIVANTVYRRANAAEAIVLVPPAFVLLGGPFLHTTQLAIAVPALLILLHRYPAFRRPLAAGLLIMAIPWLELAENPLVADFVAVGAALSAIAVSVLRTAPARTAAIVVAGAATAGAERYVRTHFPPLHVDVRAELARAASGSFPADATWAIHERGTTLATPWFIASHLPAWTGLLCMILGAYAITRLKAQEERTGASPAVFPVAPDPA